MKKNKILISAFLVGTSLLATVVSAQNYDPNYNYNNSYSYQQQPYYVDPNSYNSSNNYNSNYNYGYNNYQSVSYAPTPTPCYSSSYGGGCNSNYNYNNNYNNGYNYTSQTLYPTTDAATYANSNSATINGNVSVSGGNNNYYSNNMSTAWFQYGTSGNLNQTTNPTSIYSTTNINAKLTNLQCGTTYYFRAVASSQNGLQYGSTLSFTTSQCYNNYNSNNYSNYYPMSNYNNSMPNNVNTHCTGR